MSTRFSKFFYLAGLVGAILFYTGGSVKAETLTCAAIGKTSDTYILAVSWSTALNKAGSDVDITPLEGGGTVKLLRGVAGGRWDIGFIGSPHYVNALEGTLKFEKDPAHLREKYKEIRALFGIVSGMAQYVVRADSHIQSIPDLKGKKVGIGRPGGMGGTVTQAVFQAHGLESKKDYTPQYLDYNTALDEMRNNRLDATMIWGGVPHAAAYNFSRQIPIRFLPIDHSNFAAFKKDMPQGQWYVLRTFSPEKLKEAYGEKAVSQNAPADFWTFQMQVVCRAEIPDETAYAIVKGFWENLDRIKSASAALSIITHQNSLEALSAKLHPGARKYYQEKGWIQ